MDEFDYNNLNPNDYDYDGNNMNVIDENDIINCFVDCNRTWDDDCREAFNRETNHHKFNIKKVSRYLSLLKEKNDDFKIKHLKKLYRLYICFYQIKSIIYSKDTFEYSDNYTFLDDVYHFLIYVNDCIKADIIKFIDIIQDDKFDNDELLREEIDKDKFNIFLKYKHYR